MRTGNKLLWKPGTMLYPAPAVLVSCGSSAEDYNIITIGWTGNICSEPAMTFVSIRPSRLSHGLIKKTGEFVINLSTPGLAFATDFCGVRSGRETDKFKTLHLTPLPATHIKAPLIAESPLNIECKVMDIRPLGSHDMFLAKVLCIHADKTFLDRKGGFDMKRCGLLCFAHGKYYSLGRYLGHFGFSVRKKGMREKKV